MTETSKNQPTFHIQQVGNINTGDVTIHGDQVGIQHQSIQEKKQKEQPKNVSLPQDSLSTMPNSGLKPLTVFFSYAHEDESLRDKLATHLKSMEREGLIQGWSDRQISPGSEWDAAIKQQLTTAEIILLLISADFIASNYSFDVELRHAIERHEAGTARVIPIVLRPCDWENLSFGKLQALPKDAKPVTTWSDKDEAFLDIAKGIRAAVKSLQDISTPAPTATRTSSPKDSQPPSVIMNFHGPVYGAAGNVEGDLNYQQPAALDETQKLEGQ